jgi:hypothetical protein
VLACLAAGRRLTARSWCRRSPTRSPALAARSSTMRPRARGADAPPRAHLRGGGPKLLHAVAAKLPHTLACAHWRSQGPATLGRWPGSAGCLVNRYGLVQLGAHEVDCFFFSFFLIHIALLFGLQVYYKLYTTLYHNKKTLYHTAERESCQTDP